MIVLLGIGFLAGFVTAISPCVLPVLPILLAGGASGRKPFRIVAGLILSFVVFTLFASWILDKLGLPQDLLRNIAIALLFLVAATLIFPRFGTLLERPFVALTRRRAGGGGFVLGMSLGLVFVPCAGPVLAAITVVAAQNHVGLRAVALTLAYACGAALPMLLIAFGGQRVGARLRTEGAHLRLASGIVIAFVALGITLHADERFATVLPGYTQSLQKHIEDSSAAKRQLAKLRGGTPIAESNTSVAAAAGLEDHGPAPKLVPGGDWFNTPPLTLAGLKGKVVLIDFWTYSCINCLRTLPHLEAWDAAYRSKGLVIVGVHTPEFAFEHVSSNVASAIKRLGVKYPVVQDNDYGTWTAWSNQYWPAEYLIDRTGNVRHVHYGEGEYDATERAIRALLGTTGAKAQREPDMSPTEFATPESYLGWGRIDRYFGSRIQADTLANYVFPKKLPQNTIAYDGKWRVDEQRIVAGKDARLRLHYVAKNVYLVLGGKGRVQVLVGGEPTHTVDVDSYRLYTLRSVPKSEEKLLELRFTPGVQAYAFTFG